MLSLLGLHYQGIQSTDRMTEAYNDQKLQSLRYYIEQCKHAWLVCISFIKPVMYGQRARVCLAITSGVYMTPSQCLVHVSRNL
jgi:hypothetical protein